MLLLVPGSFGFHSMTALLGQRVMVSIGTAFSMFLLETSLVAGMLVASAALPPRHAL